jgi:hypothetical protein
MGRFGAGPSTDCTSWPGGSNNSISIPAGWYSSKNETSTKNARLRGCLKRGQRCRTAWTLEDNLLHRPLAHFVPGTTARAATKLVGFSRNTAVSFYT